MIFVLFSFNCLLLLLLGEKGDRFRQFLGIKEKETKAQLGGLLAAPAQRVPVYCKLLGIMERRIGEGHPRHPGLSNIVAQWNALDLEVEAARRRREAKVVLARVQRSFATNELVLGPDTNETSSCAGGAQAIPPNRRWSSASNGWKAGLNKVKGALSGSGATLSKKTATEKAYALAAIALGRHSSSPVTGGGEAITSGENILLKEGVVSGRHDKRVLFLFDTMLIVGKPRGKNMNTFKAQLKLSEAWIYLPDDTEYRLVVGAPHDREIIIEMSSEERSEWGKAIADAITNAKMAAAATGEVMIYPFIRQKAMGVDGMPNLVTLKISSMDSTESLIKKFLTTLHVPGEVSTFTLYELCRGSIQRLKPHECPFSIKTAGALLNLRIPLCDFALRNSDGVDLKIDMLPPNIAALVRDGDDTVTSPGSGGGKFMAGLKNLGAKLSGGGSSGTPQRSASVGKPAGTIHPPQGMGSFFNRPLAELMPDGKVPKVLDDMISRLYFEGSSCPGLFRKSANARLVRETRERLDRNEAVDFNDLPILAVGAILKEFLRSMPDSLLTLRLYPAFIEAAVAHDKIETTKSLLERLPPCNATVLYALLPLFVRICENVSDTSMTPRNIGICLGQSIMWPPRAEDVLKNDVPPFIEFIIENAVVLFGARLREYGEDPRSGSHEKGYLQIVSDDTARVDNAD